MEVLLYCVFVLLLKFSDLATLHFHFNAPYYFVSNLSLGSKSDPVSFSLPSIHCRMERGKFKAFYFQTSDSFEDLMERAIWTIYLDCWTLQTIEFHAVICPFCMGTGKHFLENHPSIQSCRSHHSLGHTDIRGKSHPYKMCQVFAQNTFMSQFKTFQLAITSVDAL